MDSGEASEEISELDQELRGLRDGLLDGIPIEPAERSPDQQARFVLARMMEFHRREDKAAWWEYFRLRDLRGARTRRRAARALQGLRFEAVLERRESRRCSDTRFHPQEIDSSQGRRGLRRERREGWHGRGVVNLALLYDRRQEDARKPRTGTRMPCSSTSRWGRLHRLAARAARRAGDRERVPGPPTRGVRRSSCC